MVLNESGGSKRGRSSLAWRSIPVTAVPIVTWGKNNGSGFDIVESHFENGAWTTPAVHRRRCNDIDRSGAVDHAR